MRTIQFHFHKELLPPPRAFYERELGRLSRPDRKNWASARCPFHQSKSKGKSRSFYVNLESGGFNCFGCGVHGGDVLAFVRLRDGLGFKEAAQQLGCWDEAPSPETVRKLQAQAYEHARLRVIEDELQAEQHRNRMVLRDQIHMAERIQREASERLDELHHGAVPATANEQEDCWIVMALALDYERDCERQYMAASGLGHSDEI
jgi:CHC2 zinc finger